MSKIGEEKFHNIQDALPNFNGRVIIRYEHEGELKRYECWYETGNRRFTQGFSLLPPYLIPKIVDWTDARKEYCNNLEEHSSCTNFNNTYIFGRKK